MSAAPAVYVINRVQDEARRARFSAAADAAGLSFEIVEAMDGHDPWFPYILYRDLIGETFWGLRDVKPGAVGCWLSHLKAWRRLLASEHESALIFEDDAAPTARMAEIEAVAQEARGADLVFVNARMVAWREAAGLDPTAPPAPLGEVVSGMLGAGAAPGEGGLARGPGADAYLLTRTGARKLIAAARRDRIVCGVDWLMIWRGFASDALPADARWPEFAALRAAPGPGLADLDARVASIALAETDAGAVGGSVIVHGLTRSIDALDGPRILIEDADTGDRPSLRMPEGDLRDPVHAAHVAGRLHEPAALEATFRWAPRGAPFADFGAHVGAYSVLMARCAGARALIPAECGSRAVKAYRRAMELNGLVQIVSEAGLGVGLGAERGKLQFFGSPRNLSNGRLKEGFEQKVNVRRADGLLRDAAAGFVKVDVNGAERDVLRGARGRLRKDRPVVGVDTTPRRAERLAPLMERLGYRSAEVIALEEDGSRLFVIYLPRSELRPAEA